MHRAVLTAALPAAVSRLGPMRSGVATSHRHGCHHAQQHSPIRSSSASATDRASDASDPWNKPPLALTDTIYSYLLSVTREPDVLRRLRVETASMRGSQMQVPPEQGQLLGLLVELLGARRVLEVGTYTGYSSIAMALALPDTGTLVACDVSEETMAVAKRWWREAGVEHKIEPRLGDARVTLDALIASGAANTFDVAFIDADKRAYGDYYEQLLTLVRPGGLIAVDNVLWYGRIARGDTDKATAALREFNAFVAADARVSYTMVPIGDGLSLCRKR